jgi:hypothetical protein
LKIVTQGIVTHDSAPKLARAKEQVS